jgi:hypothetical protein
VAPAVVPFHKNVPLPEAVKVVDVPEQIEVVPEIVTTGAVPELVIVKKAVSCPHTFEVATIIISSC